VVGLGLGLVLALTAHDFLFGPDWVSSVLLTAYCAAAGALLVVGVRLVGRVVRGLWARILAGVLLFPAALWLAGDLLYALLIVRSYSVWQASVRHDADGVREGCAERSFPAMGEGTADTALLLIHGFGDSPAVYQRMAPALAEQGYDCVAMRLPGSGVAQETVARPTLDDWARAVDTRLDELRRSHRHVVVVAHSMGAAVAIDRLSERPQAADGLVLIAPLIQVSGKRSPLLPPRTWFAILDRLLVFTDVTRTPFPPDVKDAEAARLIQRDLFNPRSTHRQLFALVERNRDRAKTFRKPLLMLRSDDDAVVDTEAAEQFFLDCASRNKRDHLFHDSAHVIPLDFEWREATEDIVKFVEEVRR
jgi:alpha-beta hydrolase superfamily lysophospholipase